MIKIFTDTSANLPVSLTDKYNITVLSFSYTVNGKELPADADGEFDGAEFYSAMRGGADIKTSMKNNLKLLRKSKGYTQIAVQMKTGIEQALLSKFENGERVPPTETLIRLADFYDVSIDYILCRTNNPHIEK